MADDPRAGLRGAPHVLHGHGRAGAAVKTDSLRERHHRVDLDLRAARQRDTPIATRAGGSDSKNEPYTSLTSANVRMSVRYTVSLTASPSVAPAAWQTAARFSRQRPACSPAVAPTSSPVRGSSGIWPEQNSRPPARTAWT